MLPEEREHVLAWLAKADADLRMAHFALDDTGGAMPDQVAFHAQQAAEKALKAVLVADGRFVPRTHNLTLLADALAPHETVTDEFLRQCTDLSLYAVGSRYPDFDEPDPAKAESALAFAEVLVAKVRAILEL